MSETGFNRLQQLEREEKAVRELLDSNLSAITRPLAEDLLRTVLLEIEEERANLKASGQAA